MKVKGTPLDPCRMELIATGRGRDSLWCDDWEFIHNLSHGSKWYYRCVQRHVAGILCRATVHTDEGGKSGFVLQGAHSSTCHDKPGLKLARKAIQDCKNIAAYSLEKPAAIVSRVDASLPLFAAMHLPLKRNLVRSARASRSVAQGYSLSANSLSTVACPPALMQHFGEKDQTILQFDSGKDDPQRMIMLGTEASLDLLLQYDQWHGDGTFRCVPRMFQQMFSIHVRINRSLWPACLVLLAGKQQMKYEAVLRILLDLRPALADKAIRFTSDFELAIRNAVKSVFPGEVHSYCLFHLLKSVWRAVQRLGFQRQYCADMELSLAVRMLPALCFVPPVMVSAAYCDILKDDRYQAIVQQYPVLKEFVEYFERTYIGQHVNFVCVGNPVYPIDEWSCYERTLVGAPRTNNGVEGFHNAFNNVANVSHPEFWKMSNVCNMMLVSNDHERFRREYRGDEGPKERRIYRWRNERVYAAVRDYSQRSSFYDYCKHLAQSFKMRHLK